MASGDTLFVLQPRNYVAPATSYATLSFITETSTPNAIIPVLAFDGSSDEYADWHVIVPSNYSGTTGFTFKYSYKFVPFTTLSIEFF